MDLSRGDTNVKYLILVVLVLVPIAAAHNISVPEEDRSFAMCDRSTTCEGVTVGDACIGIQHRDATCVAPENASERRHAEAQCGLAAQGVCNANRNMTGMNWLDHETASYNGRSCSEWASEDNIQLLKCEDTFGDITRWTANE